MKYKNGQIWKSPAGHIAVLQYLNDSNFCLLGCQGEALHGGTCLGIITDPDKSGKWLYKYDELNSRLEKWSLLCTKIFELSERDWIDTGK